MPSASQRNLGANEQGEMPAPGVDPARATELHGTSPPARDAFATLNEEDFELHDTIPAPPWDEESLDSSESTLPSPD